MSQVLSFPAQSKPAQAGGDEPDALQPSAVVPRRRDVRVLTGVGAEGVFAVSEELSQKLCLLENNELLVLEDHRFAHDVLEFMAELDKAGYRYVVVDDVRPAEFHDIAAHGLPEAATTATVDSEETSLRQQEILALLSTGMKLGATDIHFVITRGECTVLMRVDKALRIMRRMKSEQGTTLCRTAYQSMTDVASPVFEPSKPQDGRIKLEFLDLVGMDGCRLATIPTDQGFDMVLRLLARSNEEKTLEALGWHPAQAETIRRLTTKQTGLNFFSGPTGSGKSSSLKVMMERLIANFQNELKVYTAENPPEQRIRGASQVPVHHDDWPRMLKALLRVDPDVLLIGEMRDAASAMIGVQASLTGHGVWTTLHSNDAVAIIQRLLLWGLDRDVILDHKTVTGLFNQTLVRKLCPDCSVPWTSVDKAAMDEAFIARVESHCELGGVRVRGAGCERCNGGIRGLTICAEVCTPDERFMEVYGQSGPSAARAYWRKTMKGMTKLGHMITKINDGVIDPAIGESMVDRLDAEDDH